jgi:DNA helicase HerA-like ATPase
MTAEEEIEPTSEDIFLGKEFNIRDPRRNRAFAYLGKIYTTDEQPLEFRRNVFLDCSEAHVILIAGKKGSGKSYTMGVFVEELIKIMERFPNQISILIIDTMGTFSGIGQINDEVRDIDIESWKICPRSFENFRIFVPAPSIDKIQALRRRFEDSPERVMPLYLRPGDLDVQDWVFLSEWKSTKPSAGLLSEAVSNVLARAREENEGITDNVTIQHFINEVEEIPNYPGNVQNAVLSRLSMMNNWNLFSSTGPRLRDLVPAGQVSIVDLSIQGFGSGASLDTLMLALFTRKIYEERMISKRTVPIDNRITDLNRGIPFVWLVVDEAHKYLDSSSFSKKYLQNWVQQGRSPGLGTVMATQSPKDFPEVINTNMDILIAHKLVTKTNVEKIKRMAVRTELDEKLFNDLPDRKGSAVIIDTESTNRAIIGFVKPRLTKHTGRTATLYDENNDINTT